MNGVCVYMLSAVAGCCYSIFYSAVGEFTQFSPPNGPAHLLLTTTTKHSIGDGFIHPSIPYSQSVSQSIVVAVFPQSAHFASSSSFQIPAAFRHHHHVPPPSRPIRSSNQHKMLAACQTTVFVLVVVVVIVLPANWLLLL